MCLHSLDIIVVSFDSITAAKSYRTHFLLAASGAGSSVQEAHL